VRVGADVQLAGVCSSSLGPVKYYNKAGNEITSVKCPASNGNPVIVIPKADSGGGNCPVKGKKFSVVGEIVTQGWPFPFLLLVFALGRLSKICTHQSPQRGSNPRKSLPLQRHGHPDECHPPN
jgi:hypothetical protein